MATYADRAKAIMKKYSRRENDKMSKDAMDRELSQLMQEQEAARAQMAEEAMETLNNLGFDQNMMACGGKLHRAYGGKLYVNGGPFKTQEEGDRFRQWVNTTYGDYAKQIQLDPTGSYDNAYINKAYDKYGNEYETSAASAPSQPYRMEPVAPRAATPVPMAIEGAYGSPVEPELPTGNEGDLLAKGANAYINATGEENPFESQFNPLLAGAQGVGDVLGLAYSMKPADDVEYGRLNFTPTDTSAQEQAIRQGAATGAMNVREMQRRNPNAGIAGQISATTQLASDQGRNIAMMKADAAEKDRVAKLGVDAKNLDLERAETERNIQQRDAKRMNQVQHLQNIGNVATGAYKDYRADQTQQDILSLMQTGNYKYIRDANGQLQIVPIV